MAGKQFQTTIVIGGKVAQSLSKALKKSQEQVSGAMSKIGSVGKVVGKATMVASAAAATGLIAITKSAYDNFAEFEQLIGGTELLFGDAFGYVEEQAKNAYKTVQMSTNDYLQQVNGFSTGLKTALKGDAKAAAELSHKIVVAEADIIAATGESQENIQNAFNGIMKSNFQMLDNLKLGITPTKEGFQEVIKKVNEWNTANGEATKYQIDNLADCQSALVDYIEMQGLSGYAAKEASGTIQGSLSMVQASWSNLLTGLADPSQNLSELIQNLLESVTTFGSNLMPVISTILDSLPSMISTLGTAIITKIPELFSQLLPPLVSATIGLLQTVIDILPQIATMLPTIIPVLLNGVIAIVRQIASMLPTLIPLLIDAMAQIVVLLANSFSDIIQPIIDNLPLIITSIVQALTNNLPLVIEGLLTLAFGIARATPKIIFPLIKSIPSVVKMIFGALWKSITLIFSKVGSFFGGVFSSGVKAISNAFSGVVGFFSGIWQKIKSIFSQVGTSIANGIGGAFKSVINSIIGFAQNTINGLIQNINKAILLINEIPGVNIPTIKTLSIPRLATGGSFDGTKPQLAVVGDAPETMVPHGNTSRNRALLAEAARGVGVGLGNNITITFAPVIYGGSGAEVRQAISDSETEFERKMDAYFAKKGCVSFA